MRDANTQTSLQSSTGYSLRVGVGEGRNKRKSQVLDICERTKPLEYVASLCAKTRKAMDDENSEGCSIAITVNGDNSIQVWRYPL